MRESLRGGGDLVELARRRRRTRHPPLVVRQEIGDGVAAMAVLDAMIASADTGRAIAFP